MTTDDSGTRQAEELALTKYRALMPYLQGKATLASIARMNKISVRTASRWLNSLDKNGFAGLKRQHRADQGTSKIPTALRNLVEGLFLQRPPMPASAIHRRIKDICDQQGWKFPSYSSVYGIVQAIEPAMVVLAQEGRKVYKEKFDLVLTREADRPNDIWQADHKELDITVLHDGKPCRPWLTAIIDDYSRAVPGYYIGPEAPSVLRTALAFRLGIWKKALANWAVCGIPEEFYVDHGSDFTSRHLEQVAADLKVTLTFSIVGEPRGRGKIERFFRSVNQLLCAGLPGYLSPRTKIDSPLLTLAQFQEIFDKWLIDDYLYREHSEIQTTPFEKWNRDGFVPRLPDSLEQLDLLLLTVKKDRSVRIDGIHFDTMRYTNMALAAIVGRSITIRYDPRDLAEIKVYLLDQFFCTAICEAYVGKSTSIKDISIARNRRRKTLEREINARSELVKLYMESSGFGKIEDGYEPPAPSSDSIQRQNKNGLKIYATDIKIAEAGTTTIH